jgi:hypothetical protein
MGSQFHGGLLVLLRLFSLSEVGIKKDVLKAKKNTIIIFFDNIPMLKN